MTRPTAALFCALALLLAACGGPRVNGGALIEEFDRYEKEIVPMNPLPPASEALEAGREKRDQAKPVVDKGGDWEVYPLLEEAVADARTSLAAARWADAETDAQGCLRTVEEARQDWDETILMLEQTERVATRTMSDVPRAIPEETDPLAGEPLPPTNMNGPRPPAMTADEMTAAFDAWLAAGRTRNVTTADLESRFRDRIALVTGEKAKEKDKPRHLYVAGRALQEIEARVREREALEQCVRATALAGRYSEARDKALRATLELERSLKAGLRDELDKARQEALDRQADLYDALHKLEGRFATITKNARGTIVSLADILFDFNKATLKRDVEFNLVKIATILEQFPEMAIQVEGHTDNVGTPEYNMDLSLKRAQAVADFLESQGVDHSRLSVEGFGLTRPVADNATEAGRQKNRRVDLVINEKK